MVLVYSGFFVFGLIVGSFLNVLVFRSGFMEKARPRSSCLACGHTLAWYELIPLVSFVLLRGRCSACGSALSPQYPLIELSTGFLFLFAANASFPLGSVADALRLGGQLIFWAVFLLLVVYDLRHTLVPRNFAWLLIVAAMAYAAEGALTAGSWTVLADSALGALTLAALIGSIVIATRGKGIGSGDVYIALALGVLFGLARGIEVLLLSFWIGAVVSIFLLIVKKGVRMKSEVPFVPFMFVAALIGTYSTFSPFVFVSQLSNIVWP